MPSKNCRQLLTAAAKSRSLCQPGASRIAPFMHRRASLTNKRAKFVRSLNSNRIICFDLLDGRTEHDA